MLTNGSIIDDYKERQGIKKPGFFSRVAKSAKNTARKRFETYREERGIERAQFKDARKKALAERGKLRGRSSVFGTPAAGAPKRPQQRRSSAPRKKKKPTQNRRPNRAQQPPPTVLDLFRGF